MAPRIDDRARLAELLRGPNPFASDGGDVNRALWLVLRDYRLALMDADNPPYLRDILTVVEARVRADSRRPLQSTIERELRGRGTTRRTVRTELEKHGFTVVCKRGRVWLDVVAA